MKIKAFGIARDIIGKQTMELSLPEGKRTVSELKQQLMEQYPALGSMASFGIAINAVYADAESKLQDADEVAIIPPVSGG